VTPQDIIADAKIQQMHWGNFGSSSPREVVDEGVWSIGFGYGTGSTCCQILHSHKLITNPRSGRYIRLTRKGTLYFRALAKQKGVLT
jgi:hypothetical protein